jgi:hypothetical protein
MTTATITLATEPIKIDRLRGSKLLQPIPFSVHALPPAERKLYLVGINHLIPCVVPGCPEVCNTDKRVSHTESASPIWNAFIDELFLKENIPIRTKPLQVAGVSLSARFICPYHPRKRQVEVVRKYDPLRDHSDEQVRFQEYQFSHLDGRNPEYMFKQLLRSFDGEESFMTGGNQKVLGRTDVQRLYLTPEWMFSDKLVLEHLKKEFPNLGKCDKASLSCPCMKCRRLSAAVKWYTVIVMYFRMYKTAAEIEQEYRWLTGQVANLVKGFLRAERGLNRDGTRKTGNPRGRPRGWRKKSHPIHQATLAVDLAAA